MCSGLITSCLCVCVSVCVLNDSHNVLYIGKLVECHKLFSFIMNHLFPA